MPRDGGGGHRAGEGISACRRCCRAPKTTSPAVVTDYLGRPTSGRARTSYRRGMSDARRRASWRVSWRGSCRGSWRGSWLGSPRGSRRDLVWAVGLVVVVLGGVVTAPPGRQPLDPIGYLLPVIAALSTAARRRVPVLVLAVTTICLLVYRVRGYPEAPTTLPVL